VEDDKPFLERLSRAMETRGFTVTSSTACPMVWRRSAGPRRPSPWWICGLGDGNGLDVVSALKRKRPTRARSC